MKEEHEEDRKLRDKLNLIFNSGVKDYLDGKIKVYLIKNKEGLFNWHDIFWSNFTRRFILISSPFVNRESLNNDSQSLNFRNPEKITYEEFEKYFSTDANQIIDEMVDSYIKSYAKW